MDRSRSDARVSPGTDAASSWDIRLEVSMLTSQLLSGDQLLEGIADGGPDRVSTTRHANDPAVAKVQRGLLIRDPDCLPRFGADGSYGSETAAAVHAFKVDELGVNEGDVVDDVGPQTVVRLDQIALAAENPTPPAQQLFIRQDVYTLQPTAASPLHPIIAAYARAVEVLRTDAGPGPERSWTHHTQVHGMRPDPADGLRNTCQHATWYFLPWHRMELFWFESICRSIITGLPDIDDETKQTWALPYWDYDRDGARALPFAFRSATLDGRPNPLFEVDRGPGINGGSERMTDDITTSRFWFPQTRFSSNQPALSSFGGFRTGFHHPIGDFPFGQLEGGPHNNVHGTIGGRMNNPNTAAGDPIFYLHHANIDRLWEVWRQNTGVGQDETDGAYLSLSFNFLDETGATRPHEPQGVVDTGPQLDYTYADTSVPGSASSRGRRSAPVNQPGNSPRTVGSISEPLDVVSGQPNSVVIALDELPSPDRRMAGRVRMMLMVEHITASATPDGVLGLFVTPSDGSDEELAGTLPMFGLLEADDPDAEHGLSFVFDITDLLADLTSRDAFDPAGLSVAVRPVGDPDGLLDGLPDVSIGNISLLVADDDGSA